MELELDGFLLGLEVFNHEAGKDGHHHLRIDLHDIFRQCVDSSTDLSCHRNSKLSIVQTILWKINKVSPSLKWKKSSASGTINELITEHQLRLGSMTAVVYNTWQQLWKSLQLHHYIKKCEYNKNWLSEVRCMASWMEWREAGNQSILFYYFLPAHNGHKFCGST